MREPIERIACDRCGDLDILPTATTDTHGKRANWVRIHAENFRGEPVIADAEGTGPADLCKGCTEQLSDWFDAPRLEREAARA